MSSPPNNNTSDIEHKSGVGIVINIGPELSAEWDHPDHGRTDEPTEDRVKHVWTMLPDDGVIRLSLWDDMIERLPPFERGEGVRFRGQLSRSAPGDLTDVNLKTWYENPFVEPASTPRHSDSIIPPEGWDSCRGVKQGNDNDRFNIRAEVMDTYSHEQKNGKRYLSIQCLDTDSESEKKRSYWPSNSLRKQPLI